MKKLLSWILVLALCLSLFPTVALAEDAEEPAGEIAPVEDPLPPTEEEDPAEPVGADVPGGPSGDLDVPSDDPAVLLTDPAADEIQAATASGSCGENLTWTLENGVLTISGTGAMTYWSSESDVPWYSYRETITDIILPAGLTNIGRHAFRGCKYVASVTIPAGVTSIERYAFGYCSSLTSVTIPASVTSIGDSAFNGCSSLTSVTIPEGIVRIDSFAFSGCSSLTSVTIPSGVTSIGIDAFYGCSSLTSVTIPSSVTSFGSGAFNGCSGLTSVTIPSSVTSFGSGAFNGCSGIEKVNIDDLDWWLGLTDSGGNDLPHGDLYLNGKLVTSVSVPEGILGLRPGMFQNMKSLTAVTLPANLRSIGDYAFEGCSSLTTVTIPAGVTSIGHYAFRYCSSLTTVTIPSGVTSIAESAFWGCSSLTSITIPSSVASIEYAAFSGCSSLTGVTIPSGVTSIGYYAFQYCSSLTTICFLGDAPSISSDAFDDVYAAALYPFDNETWTADVRQNCVSLTWVGYRGQAKAYTIHYDPNDGSNAPADQIKGHGVDLTLASDQLSRLGFAFLGWSANPEAAEATYAPGASFSGNADTTLYAVWHELNPGETAVSGGHCGDDLSWTYYESGLLYISGTGIMVDWTRASYVPWYSYRKTISQIILPAGLTSIGSYAFEGCSSLTSVTIPEGVTSIGGSAFEGCSSLTSVTIPEGVTSIGGSAFYYCSLKTVFFLGDAPSVSSYVFSSSRTSFLYPINNETWTADKRQGFGDSLTWVGYRDEAKAYTIHYDANGGSNAPADQLKGHGVDLALSDRTPSRANEAAESYTVTLDYNGSGAANGSLEAQRTASFSFAAWNTKADGSGYSYAPGELYAVDAGLDLYAQWGSSISTSRVYLPSPGRTGYSFQGWATTSSASSGVTGYYTPEKSLTLYAIWEINTYTVSYNANGGSGALASQTKTYGVDLTLSDTVPTRTGYIFQGWSTSSYGSVNYQPGGTYSGNSNLTLYAVWKAETYTVHFDLNGGKPGYSDNDSAFPGDLTKTYGQDLRLSAYAHREGHRFLGWARDPAATEAEFQPYDYYYDNAPITLYAVWTPYTFPVVYVVGKGAQGPENQVKTWGVDLTLSDMVPTAEGYDFMGWSLYNQSNIPDYQPGDVYTGNGNGYDGSQISFYAIWQLKIYLVTYKANGGEDAPAAQLKTHGRSLTLSEEAPYRDGYRFLGWSTNKWSTEPEYQPGDSFTANKDTTLYALWEKKYPEVPTGSVLALTDAQSAAGYDFTVDLTLDENPGVMMISFKLDYDKDALEFLGGEDGALKGWYFSETGAVWDASSDRTETGCLAKLNFRVKDGADTGRTEIYITDLFTGNYNEEELLVDSVSSTVNIVQRVGGDVNSDGSVNGFDLIRLRKHLAGQTVEISPVNADANGDGVVDLLDLVRLRKHLAGVPVDLG